MKINIIISTRNRTGVWELPILKTEYTNRQKHKGVCIEFGSRTKFKGMGRWLPLSLEESLFGPQPYI